jgi:ATP-dependent helicase/DNAse subunit B
MNQETIKKIKQHYEHAKQKHPYFCDMLTELDAFSAKRFLSAERKRLNHRISTSNVRFYDVMQCELYEAEYAMAIKDIQNAIEECYDAIAVLLRTIDVLEGRQALGDPAKKTTKGE